MDEVNPEELDLMKLLNIKVYILSLQCIDDSNKLLCNMSNGYSMWLAFSTLFCIEDITFEQAWKASGFSSNMDDYFDIEDAKFVAFSTSKNYGVDTLAENIPMYSSDDLLYREFSAGFELEKGTDILIERKYVENALENAVAIAIVLNGNIYKEVPLEETDIEFTLDKSGNYVFMAVNSVGKTVDITSAIRAEKSADGGVILLN